MLSRWKAVSRRRCCLHERRQPEDSQEHERRQAKTSVIFRNVCYHTMDKPLMSPVDFDLIRSQAMAPGKSRSDFPARIKGLLFSSADDLLEALKVREECEHRASRLTMGSDRRSTSEPWIGGGSARCPPIYIEPGFWVPCFRKNRWLRDTQHPIPAK